jgi:hypothetical protein
MSKSPPGHTPATDPSLILNVAFTFEEAWESGPVRIGSHIKFPPGVSNGLGVAPAAGPDGYKLTISPIDLAGKTAAEIAQIQAQRASDIARIAQAIAIAEWQFAAALAAVES